MRMLSLIAIATLACLTSWASFADECWVAKKMQCRSSMSFKNFKFGEDSFSQGATLVCFNAQGGSVTGDDLQFVKMGESTLVGVSVNGHGLETVSTYQIDRNHHKLFYTISRIGTASLTPILPDKVAACVGDVVQAPEGH